VEEKVRRVDEGVEDVWEEKERERARGEGAGRRRLMSDGGLWRAKSWQERRTEEVRTAMMGKVIE
jgi:hypothetical protein